MFNISYFDESNLQQLANDIKKSLVSINFNSILVVQNIWLHPQPPKFPTNQWAPKMRDAMGKSFYPSWDPSRGW